MILRDARTPNGRALGPRRAYGSEALFVPTAASAGISARPAGRFTGGRSPNGRWDGLGNGRNARGLTESERAYAPRLVDGGVGRHEAMLRAVMEAPA